MAWAVANQAGIAQSAADHAGKAQAAVGCSNAAVIRYSKQLHLCAPGDAADELTVLHVLVAVVDELVRGRHRPATSSG
jgi:hypothetical protein